MAKSILHDEHLLLGALMADGADGRTHALHYLSSADMQGDALTLLSDLTGLGSRLIYGAGSEAFVSAAFAGERLAIGEVSVEAVLAGDGALVSVALLARTGDAEYACWDLCGRGDVLSSWLSFLAGIEQKGIRAFQDVQIEDASEALVPLLLWGPEATSVLCDYLHGQTPPEPGTVRNLTLDAIGCLVAHPMLDNQPCYLVLVPPRSARVLWRSFLSFTSVTPVGTQGLLTRVATTLPTIAPACESGDRVIVAGKELKRAGLVRSDPSFVGARSLA